MEKQYLPLEQNIRGARVFLNIFGLTLEEQDKIDEYSKLKIFNTNNEEVGIFYFENGTVNISATSDFGKLNAAYDITSYWGFNDYECGGTFVQWKNDIKFNVLSEGDINFQGNVLVGCSMDTDFGIKCLTHTLLEYEQEEKKVTLKFMRDGKSFMYEMVNGDEEEIIEMNPCDIWGPFVLHRITKGKYDRDFGGFPYRKYVGVCSERECDNKMLRLLSFVEENGIAVSYSDDFIPMNGDNESRESVIQKGLLMQKANPLFVKKIEDIKNTFVRKDISLIDNFIATSFSSYSDEEVEALFGFEIKKVNFQNGTNNLVDAYYGSLSKNKQFQEDYIKKLLK